MAYSDFKTVSQVKTTFDLSINLGDLFSGLDRVEPSEYLKMTLKRNLKVAFDNDTKKARSELIIAPLLMDVREMFDGKVSLFSGRNFNVDATQGLNGFCDYILSASEFTLEIEAPVVAIVEAKNESTNPGLGQCIAEMVAAQKFNQARDKVIANIYGAVTTGRLWRFLKLDDRTVSIDNEKLVIEDAEDINISKIIAILTVRVTPAGRWYASILVDDLTIQPLPKTDKAIGLDVGITSLITTSNGDKVANPKHFKKLRKKLKRKQKALARKQKGSNNRNKARIAVAKVHAQIVDARTDFLHKLTTQLVRENQTIAVEDLAIENLVKNRKLALAISDASWGELIRQLTYKCNWYGRELIKIDRWFPSSKRCGNCGHVVEKLPLNVREWDCPNCGAHHDRDINAAKNILAALLAVKVCGATVRPGQSKSVRASAKNPQGKEAET